VAAVGPDPPCRYIEPCGWIQASFGTAWREPVLGASKLDNDTAGPNYLCKVIGGRPGRNQHGGKHNRSNGRSDRGDKARRLTASWVATPCLASGVIKLFKLEDYYISRARAEHAPAPLRSRTRTTHWW
jgi:hypothetical protein